MLYINDFCSYTAGGVIDSSTALNALQQAGSGAVFAQEPGYKDIIPPMQLRRMSKPIRMSVAAVKSLLARAATADIAAINVGTAYGMLTDTEQFLKQLVLQEEQMLTPTAFIQSTQNTVGGQIALMLQCKSHNMTYVHRGHSFEQALLDIELMEPEACDQYIVGGVDELTHSSYKIINALLQAKAGNEQVSNLSEGVGFFNISKQKNDRSKVLISAFEMLKIGDKVSGLQRLKDVLTAYNISSDAVWVLGNKNQHDYETLYSPLLLALGVRYTESYKQYTSDYPTVAASGLAYAARLLMEQDKEQIVLVQNYYSYWSIFILERV